MRNENDLVHAMISCVRVLAICVFAACLPKPIVYRPAASADLLVQSVASEEPTQSPPIEKKLKPATQQPIPKRTDFTVPTLPVGLALQNNTLVWSDLGGAVWTMPSDASTAPKRLSEQHADGFVFRPFVAGQRVLGKIDKDLVTIGLPNGPVEHQHIKGIDGLPEAAVGDDTATFITVFKHTEVLRVADGTSKRIADSQRGVLALRDKTLYVASYTTGELVAVAATGGRPKTVAKHLARPTEVVADDQAVYVHTEGDHRVIKVDLATGARETLGDNLENADVLVLDRGSVYTMSWPNKLLRLTSGSAPVTLADDLEEPRAIAVDDKYVYVTTAKPPRIVRIAK